MVKSIELRGRRYEVDDEGFLLDERRWNHDFAAGLAPEVGVEGELTDAHWSVIGYIRQTREQTGCNPRVYETCKACGLDLAGLRLLFPAGHWRGACRLAGMNYLCTRPGDKQYRIDSRGHLVDPAEWDEDFVGLVARDLGLHHSLTDAHWEMLRFLRERFESTGRVPTVYETCETLGLTVDDLASMFPAGYHRGAVRLAGLRLG